MDNILILTCIIYFYIAISTVSTIIPRIPGLPSFFQKERNYYAGLWTIAALLSLMSMQYGVNKDKRASFGAEIGIIIAVTAALLGFVNMQNIIPGSNTTLAVLSIALALVHMGYIGLNSCTVILIFTALFFSFLTWNIHENPDNFHFFLNLLPSKEVSAPLTPKLPAPKFSTLTTPAPKIISSQTFKNKFSQISTGQFK